MSPSTAAVFRCAYAVPLLAVLAARESRRYGPRPRARSLDRCRRRLPVLRRPDPWHHSIANVGAGLATVLGNLQVVLVAFAAWAVLGERPERRIVDGGARRVHRRGDDLGRARVRRLRARPGARHGLRPPHHARLHGFILVLRQINRDLRRPAGPLLDATAASAVVSAVAGALLGERRPRAELAVACLAGAAGADLAGARVAADLGLAAAAPGRADLRAAARPARRARSRSRWSSSTSSPRRSSSPAPWSILVGICLATVTLPRRRAPVAGLGRRWLTLK